MKPSTPAANTVLELGNPRGTGAWIDLRPIAEERVGETLLRLDGVVEELARLLDRLIIGEAEIEHGPHAIHAGLARSTFPKVPSGKDLFAI